MNSKGPELAEETAPSLGFDDLSALKAAHTRLLRQQEESANSFGFLESVERFVIRAQATGRVLGEDDDRISAQTIMDYWFTVLLRAHRKLPDACAHGLAEFAAPSATGELREQSVDEYLADERSAIRARLRLSAAAAQWVESGGNEGMLWSGTRLEEADRYSDLSKQEQEFIHSSRALTKRIKRTRMIAIGVIVGVVIAFFVWRDRTNSRNRKDAQHALATQFVERASVAARERDIAGSLLWMEQALRMDYQASFPDDIHRVRIGAAIAQLPRLEQVLVEPNKDFICNTAELSRDGKLVLTVANPTKGLAGIARLWDAGTGAKLADLPSPQGRINQALFSAAGHVFTASGGSGQKAGAARLWDRTGKCVIAFEDIKNPVLFAAFSPDGKRLALIRENDDQTASVEVRETELGRPLTESLGWGGPIKHVAFSPDGEYVIACGSRKVSGQERGMVMVWNASREVESNFNPSPEHKLPVSFAVFNPTTTGANATIVTGSSRAGGGTGEIQLWLPSTGERLFQRETAAAVSSIAFSPDGRRFVVSGQDQSAQVYDADSGKILQNLQHESGVTGARYSPDGRYIITGSRDQTGRVWRAATGQLALPPLQLGRTVATPSFSSDGERMLAATPDAAYLWRIATGEPMAPILKLEDSVRRAAISTDGSRVAAIGETGEVSTCDLRSGESTIYRRSEAEHASGIFFSPDAQYVLLTAEKAATIWKTEPEKGDGEKAKSGRQVGGRLMHPRPITYAAFSPDGRYVLTSCGRADSAVGDARIWNVETGAAVCQPLAVKGGVEFALFTPDSHYVITAGGTTAPPTGEAQVWEVTTGRPVLKKALDHVEPIHYASFNAKLNRIVTAGADDVARLWSIDVASGRAEQIQQLNEHSADLTRACFSPGGDTTLIVTTGYDRMAVLWESEGDKRRAVLQHPGWINDASFSADGRFLVTAGADGAARVWETEKGNFVALFPHEGGVTHARFAPDGASIVTLSSYEPARTLFDTQRELLDSRREGLSPSTIGSADITKAARTMEKIRIWRLEPWILNEGSADDQRRTSAQLRAFAEITRSRRFNEENQRDLMRFDRAWLTRLWSELRPGYAANFLHNAPTHSHRHDATESEMNGEWFAARWHLARSLEEKPNDVDLLTRDAVSAGHLGLWDEAAADYTKALAARPGDPNLLGRRARVHAELGQWETTLADTDEAIKVIEKTKLPGDSAIHRRRAGALAALGRFEEAVVDLQKAIELKSDDSRSYRRLASLRLKQNDLPGYRAVCQKMLQITLDGELASAAAWTCVLGPGATDEPESVVKLAQEPLKKAPERYSFRNNLGAALFRAGKFAEAIEEINYARRLYAEAMTIANAIGPTLIGVPIQSRSKGANSDTTGPSVSEGRPQDWVFLAMAYSAQGELDKARYWLEMVDLWLGGKSAKVYGDEVWERTEIELLRNEARRMLPESR